LAGKQALWRFIQKWWIDPVCLPSLNAARAQQQMAPVTHFFDHMLKAANASVALFPDWFAAEQPDWPQPFWAGRFPNSHSEISSPAELSTELDRFLSEGDAPILITLGTGHQHAKDHFSTALKVLKRMGRRGLFVSQHAAQVPQNLPPTVMWQAYAPFGALLPRMAAIVHHGGIGTMAEAFRAGVPQLIVPFAFDQFDNALRAQRLGVGEILMAKRFSTSRLTRRLETLLFSARVGEACAALATRMQQNNGSPYVLNQIESALGLQSTAAHAAPL
ncbi:MAG: nucleotide disphospho-sugar-binding domain-containing protein, partial [Hydrogenophaga sp.]